MSGSTPAFLIVNADDLGLALGIDRAIFAAHVNGIVTSTSLMPTGGTFDAAVRELASHPALGVGVHLCLHEERPVLAPEKIPSLVGSDGRMLPLATVIRRAFSGSIEPSEIYAEYCAQVERVRNAGVAVDHLDSHCHLHALPPIASLVQMVAERFEIRCVRKPEASNWLEYTTLPFGRIALAAAITLSSKLSRWMHRSPLRTPDRFIGLVRSGNIDAAFVRRAIEALPQGSITELMVHPGDGSFPAEPSSDHGAEQRERELEAVTSPDVLRAVRERNVRLVNYRHLATC